MDDLAFPASQSWDETMKSSSSQTNHSTTQTSSSLPDQQPSYAPQQLHSKDHHAPNAIQHPQVSGFWNHSHQVRVDDFQNVQQFNQSPQASSLPGIASWNSLELSLRNLIIKNQEAGDLQAKNTQSDVPTAPRAYSQAYRKGGGHQSQGPLRYYDPQRPGPRGGYGGQRGDRGVGRGQRQENRYPRESQQEQEVSRDQRVDVMDAEEFPPLGGTPTTPTKSGTNNREAYKAEQGLRQSPSQSPSQALPGQEALQRSSPVTSFKNKKTMTLDHAFLKPRSDQVGNSRNTYNTRGYHKDAFNGNRRPGGFQNFDRNEQENFRSLRQQPNQNRKQHNGIPQHRQFYTKCPPDFHSLSTLAHEIIQQNDPTPQEENEKILILDQLQKLCDRITSGCQVIPFGSLVTGFASTNADMDLLLIHDGAEPPLDASESQVPIKLAEEFLRRGFCKVALLTQTRVPILKLTTPSANEEQIEVEIPQPNRVNPNDDEAKHQEKIHEKDRQTRHRSHSISGSSVSSFEVETHEDEWWPPNVSCDIGFSRHLGIRNSQMLQTYSMCDPRVREMVMFIKYWAKQRQINTAYKGTLSSYGYVLLCLHYLINVVTPPILPNLQLLAPPPNMPESELYSPEGYNIWFYNDRAELARLITENCITNNTMTLGQLLYEFFEYYSYSFKWAQSVISLRTPGGIISKRDKGWTTAVEREGKFEGALYKDRYLICIEDPFETSHNVGRTCFGNGAYQVKNEFQRAAFVLNKGSGGSAFDGTPSQHVLATSAEENDFLKMTTTLVTELLQPVAEGGVQKDRARERKERNYLKKCIKQGVSTTGEYRAMAFKDAAKGEKDVPEFANPVEGQIESKNTKINESRGVSSDGNMGKAKDA